MATGVLAGIGVYGILANLFQQLHTGLAAYGIDPGIQVADTGSGTSRTTTVTVWGGPVVNGPSSGWTASVNATASWTSGNNLSGPYGIPFGGPDEGSRNVAIDKCLQTLMTSLKTSLGLPTP